MTAPRQVLKGTTYLVTRRTTQRQLLLRPCDETNEIFAYVLALAARRYGIELHAYCVLSNHYHLVVTDPEARLPAFQQYLGSLVARAVNSLLGRWEALWASDGFSAVALGSPQDIVDKAAYVLANPVVAGLVRSGRQWPGLWSAPDAIGEEIQVARPSRFFSKKGYLPKSIGLKLTPPPGFSDAAGFRAALQPALAEREADARSKHQRFLGVDGVLGQWPFNRPRSGERRRQLSPRLAARNKWKRLELIGRMKDFVAEYREALSKWRRGKRNTVFPAGTYLMRVAHGAACARAA